MNLFSKVTLLLVFLMCCCTVLLLAQVPRSNRKLADQYFLAYEFNKALPLYLQLVDTEKPLFTDLERIAKMYQQMNQYEAAENWFVRVVDHPEARSEDLINYGKILKSNGKYVEAKRVFERYANQTNNWGEVEVVLAGCDSAIRWLAEPSLHVIENVGSINTPMSEFGPYRIGEELFFTAEPNDSRRHKVYGRTGNAFLKVYKAPLVNGSTVVDSHPVSSHWNNQNFHVGPLSSNKEGNILFITRTYPGKKGERSSENEFTFYTQRLELIIASKTPEGDWEEAAFPYNDIKSFSTGHAALSPDEKVLYFVSDRPGGLGGTDIWYSERLESGEWGPPIVAGSKINSPGNEMFPVMDAEGTLFFSSDGFAGMGGLDIFKSKGERNLWSKPENLKFPINEAGDDFAYFNLGIVEGQETGFFSSNRKGGEGGDDVYRVRKIIPKRKLVLLAKTYNKENNTSLEDVAVHLIDSNKNLLAKRYSSSTGVVEFPLEQIGLYTILGQKEGFYPDSAQADAVFTLHQDTLYASLYLEPLLTIGKTITLENIYYDFDKHAIRKDAAEVLDLLVGVLRDNPQMKIELGSHTDSRGPDEYNQLLSQRRAQSAVDYLVQHGISRSRLTAKGYGESQLVNRCKNGVACSIQEHQENRRTTFTILSY